MKLNSIFEKQHLIQVLLVDDENNACINLKNILENYINEDRIKIVGIANSTIEAEQLIEQLKPDAVFLDIEMPQENAFQFLNRISKINFEIIFVTAFDEYAIKALKLNALDYILKPISVVELGIAVQKLISKIDINNRLLQQRDFENLSADYNNKQSTNYVRLKTAETTDIVFFDDIIFLEALGSYSKFHFKTIGGIKVVTMSHTIAEYEDILPNNIFFRVHRSFLVNGNFLCNLKVEDHSLKLQIGEIEIPVSRRRINDFLDFYSKIKK